MGSRRVLAFLENMGWKVRMSSKEYFKDSKDLFGAALGIAALGVAFNAFNWFK